MTLSSSEVSSANSGGSGRARQRYVLAGLTWLAVSLGVVLMVLRIGANRSFSEPLQITTSGWEEAPVFQVWKILHGLPLYTNPRLLPYDLTSYNWLNYHFYGAFIKGMLELFGLSDAWIPTAGSVVAFFGTLLFGFVLWRTVLETARPTLRELRWLAVAFAIYASFGPLIGFWALALRPDVWSGLFDLLAVFVFWRLFERAPLKAVLAAAALVFVAWSFKQIGIFGTVAIGTFLLFERRWSLLAVYTAVLLTGYGVTFLIGGEVYIASILLGADSGFSLSYFTKTVGNFLVKSTPVLLPGSVGLAFLLRNPDSRREFFGDARARFVFYGTTVLTVVSVFGATHLGSAENYFFVTHAFWVLLTMVVARYVMEGDEEPGAHRAPSWRVSSFSWTLALGWLLHSGAVVMVLAGIKGVIDLGYLHRKAVAIEHCVETHPKPTYVEDLYGSLPWINPSEPVIFTNWFYQEERMAGERFPDGGVGGFIARGHFRTLFLRGARTTFDLAPLDGYRLEPDTCAGLVVYTRIASGAAAADR